MLRREYSARVYSRVLQEGEIGGNEETSHDEEQRCENEHREENRYIIRIVIVIAGTITVIHFLSGFETELLKFLKNFLSDHV